MRLCLKRLTFCAAELSETRTKQVRAAELGLGGDVASDLSTASATIERKYLAGGVLKTITRPTLNRPEAETRFCRLRGRRGQCSHDCLGVGRPRRTESARLYGDSP